MNTKTIQHYTQAIIFARVSSDKQEDGHSLDAQLELGQKYCDKNHLTPINKVSIVESSMGDRPKFYQMIDFIKKRKDKISIICHCTDRLHRDFEAMGCIMNLLKEGKIQVHILKDNVVLHKRSSASDIFRYGLETLIGNDSSNRTGERVDTVFDKKLEDGSICHNTAIGYLNKERKYYNTQNKHKREPVHVYIDPVRGPIVKRIFEDYATGLYSMKQLLNGAIKRGLTSKLKEIKPHVSTVERLLSNPFYYGVMKYDGEFYTHPYEPLITKELFDKCQELRQAKRRSNIKTPKCEKGFIYSGLITCKHCKCVYSPQLTIIESDRKYTFLRPTKSQGDCEHCKHTKEEIVTKQIVELMKGIYIPDEALKLMKDDIVKFIHKNQSEEKKEFVKLMKQQQNIQDAMDDNFNDRVHKKSITQNQYNEMNGLLKQEMVQIKNTLFTYNNYKETFKDTAMAIFELANDAMNLFLNADNNQKRELINILYSNLFLDKEKLIITPRKPFDLFLNSGTCPDWLPAIDKFRTKSQVIMETMGRVLPFEMKMLLAV